MPHPPLPKPATSRQVVLAALASLSLAGLLAGCGTASGQSNTSGPAGSPTSQCPTDQAAASALVLLVGVHRNAPAPGVPAELACDVQSTLAAGRPVAVVSVDGDPAVEDTVQFTSDAGNEAARRADLMRAENQVVSAVRGAQATSDGSDLVAGLGVAADRAASMGVPDARILVIDSGLPDRGLLDMTRKGMIGADPKQVAGFLAEQHALDKVAGMRIDLVGLGYTTAPQQPLSPAQIDNVTAIWRTALKRAGATVQVRPVPRSGPAPDTPYTTTPAPLPTDPVFDPGTQIVYDDTTALGFHPDTTRLRDPAAARAAVAELAAWLTGSPDRRATITGTCASAGTCTNPNPHTRYRDLSKARAHTIKTLLVDLGINPRQVTTKGAGYIADPPDRRADGTLDPAKAARNRAVRITTETR